MSKSIAGLFRTRYTADEIVSFLALDEAHEIEHWLKLVVLTPPSVGHHVAVVEQIKTGSPMEEGLPCHVAPVYFARVRGSDGRSILLAADLLRAVDGAHVPLPTPRKAL